MVEEIKGKTISKVDVVGAGQAAAEAREREAKEEIRSDDDKLTMAGVPVYFGGKTYYVKPLVIKAASAWRKKYTKATTELSLAAAITADNPEDFRRAMNTLAVDMPDMATELFFDYAKDLPQDEIEEIATDQQMAIAFRTVTRLAFPLLQAMTGGIVQDPSTKQ